jgi:protein-S-isoprenylcysteine O-methyltransferase Ste14
VDSTKENLIQSENKLNRDGVRGIVSGFIGIFVGLIILLISAGKISWVNAWVFFGLILSYEIIYVGLFLKVNPELLNERGKVVKEGTKFFDKIYAVLYLPLYFSILIISGLDAVRYGWTIMPLWVIFLGVVMFLSSWFLSLWAMVVNSYFECTVRIQEDRNQQVVTNGPYRIVRHPGYIAGIISFLAVPLILGSWWGLVPSSILILTVVIRSALEDRTLQRELAEYKNYTKVTRYRLIPFVW